MFSSKMNDLPWLGCSLAVGGGGGGKGLPAIIDPGGVELEDAIFLGSVLDLLMLVPFKPFIPFVRNELWLDDVLPIGESGIEPFLTPFLGGAIGPDWSALGGRGGRDVDTCSSIALIEG